MSDSTRPHDGITALNDGVRDPHDGTTDDESSTRTTPGRAFDGDRVVVPLPAWSRLRDTPVRIGERLHRRLVDSPNATDFDGLAPVAHAMLSPDRLHAGIAFIDPDAVRAPQTDASRHLDSAPSPTQSRPTGRTYRLVDVEPAGPVRVRAPGGELETVHAMTTGLEPFTDHR